MIPMSRLGAIESTTVERSAVSTSASEVRYSRVNGVLNWPTCIPKSLGFHRMYASVSDTLALPLPTDRCGTLPEGAR